MKRIFSAFALLSLFAGTATAQSDLPFDVEVITDFDEPWAMALMPDGHLLVTEKKGNLLIVAPDGSKRGVRWLPDVDYGGQGGFGDVALHPDYENNGLIYISYVETGVGNTRGAAVARAKLDVTERGGQLSDLEVIWRQYPKMVGYGHYGHRLAFDDDSYLFISSGDRQKFTPSQDMQSNVGKIVRLNDDGSVPADNPFVDYYAQDAFVDDEGVYPEIWSIGHRNPLGLTFDLDGNLWVIEMGPRHGDELNFVKRGANYGYPTVSNGEHYDGRPIPNHDTRPEFDKPAVWWVPAISPGDLMVYGGDLFADWKGNAFAAGLGSRAIVRIELDGEQAEEVERFEMGARIRGLLEDADGAIWVLEDERAGSEGRLLKLTPN